MSHSTSEIVITGAGLIGALGLNKDQSWQAIVRGDCGIKLLTAIEQELNPNRGGGQAPPLPESQDSDQPREVRYLRAAMLEAMTEAGLLDNRATSPAPNRCAVVLGTTLAGMRSAGDFFRTGDPASFRNINASSTLQHAAQGLPLAGFAITTCAACASGLSSIALGMTMLQSGECDLVVAGGYDTISEYAYAGFNSLRLVADSHLMPFSSRREGMKLGEGYGIVIMERAVDAAARNATALACVRGFGESSDAHHLTQPHPSGDGASRAIAAALQAASIFADDIDLISAHATATPNNDAAEFQAYRRIFGDRLPQIPVVAFKSQLGHTLGGAGAVELILSMMALRHQIAPPTANVNRDEIEFADLRLISNRGVPARIQHTINVSMGFGGANACVVLGLPQKEVSGARVHVTGKGRAEAASADTCFITGVGIVAPGCIGNHAFSSRIITQQAQPFTHDTGSISEDEIAHLLNARRVRRMSDFVKLLLAATSVACEDANIQDLTAFASECGAILGSTHGAVGFSETYYRQIVQEGINAANPMLFAEGVPNVGSAQLSLMMNIRGGTQTIVGSRTAGLDALHLAAQRIRTGLWNRAIVGAAEEYNPVVNSAYRTCGLYSGNGPALPFANESGFVAGCGAVVVILESAAAIKSRNARARGQIEQGAGARANSAELRGLIGSAADVLTQIGNPDFVISSANGTWIDRIEAAAICTARPNHQPVVVSSIYGHLAEMHSAGPLAALAAVLLTGRMPRLIGDPSITSNGFVPACGQEQPQSVGVMCTDPHGFVSAVRCRIFESR